MLVAILPKFLFFLLPYRTSVSALLLYFQLKLRSYGSKSVVKYPRCSLRRQSTYADAEVILSLLLYPLLISHPYYISALLFDTIEWLFRAGRSTTSFHVSNYMASDPRFWQFSMSLAGDSSSYYRISTLL